VAYSVSRIVTQQTDEHSDRLLFYGEPTPESIGPLVRIHKLHMAAMQSASSFLSANADSLWRIPTRRGVVGEGDTHSRMR
jgi:hypothetical protein